MNGAPSLRRKRLLDAKAISSGKSFLGTRHARKLPMHSVVREKHANCVRLPAGTFPSRWGYREPRKIFTHQKQKSIRCYHFTSLFFATQLGSEKISSPNLCSCLKFCALCVTFLCYQLRCLIFKPSSTQNVIWCHENTD